ncbi:LOW QUALITY PROTEIN: hypothetical protein HID58_079627 [Brassica napus]|uniref:DUF1985 domain-containing protein n=1 Tax=Brassica napus TaxID=3708 RepID=A0ABQ7Y2N6_BRANA|nr:LOW QUALITY PROTEIN: hypothetical protein HID58_079627 [Brassica napus]
MQDQRLPLRLFATDSQTSFRSSDMCFVKPQSKSFLFWEAILSSATTSKGSIFGGNPLRFSLQKFGTVIGLQCGEFPVNWDHFEKERRLIGKQKVTTIDDIRNRLETEHNVPSLVKLRLTLILIVDGVLIAHKQKARPTLKYVRMVENVNTFLEFRGGRESFLKTIITCMKPPLFALIPAPFIDLDDPYLPNHPSTNLIDTLLVEDEPNVRSFYALYSSHLLLLILHLNSYTFAFFNYWLHLLYPSKANHSLVGGCGQMLLQMTVLDIWNNLSPINTNSRRTNGQSRKTQKPKPTVPKRIIKIKWVIKKISSSKKDVSITISTEPLRLTPQTHNYWKWFMISQPKSSRSNDASSDVSNDASSDVSNDAITMSAPLDGRHVYSTNESTPQIKLIKQASSPINTQAMETKEASEVLRSPLALKNILTLKISALTPFQQRPTSSTGSGSFSKSKGKKAALQEIFQALQKMSDVSDSESDELNQQDEPMQDSEDPFGGPCAQDPNDIKKKVKNIV